MDFFFIVREHGVLNDCTKKIMKHIKKLESLSFF